MSKEDKAKRFDELIAGLKETEKAVLMDKIEELIELEKEENEIIGYDGGCTPYFVLYDSLYRRARETRKYVKGERAFDEFMKKLRLEV